MQASDKFEFGRAWGAAFTAVGRPLPDDGAVDICFAVLEPYPLDAVRRALGAHLANPDSGQYPPKPADVVRHIEGGSDARQGRATLGWSLVEGAMRSVGSYDSVVFEDANIHRVVEAMGGWIRLCNETLEDERQWKRREFERLYVAMNTGRPYLRALPGRTECDAESRGLALPAPVPVGDVDQCRLVWSGGVTNAQRLQGPQRLALEHMQPEGAAA